MLTTQGGRIVHRRLGLDIPMQTLRASILLTKEFHRLTRLWSYLITLIDFWLKRRNIPETDVVITASDYFCDVIPAVALKRIWRGSRWIAWVHHREQPPKVRPGNRLINGFTHRLQSASFDRIAKHADDIWIYDSPSGDDVAAEFAVRGVAEDSMYRMSNGVDMKAVDAAPEGSKVVDAIMIGLRPNKGLHDVIPVWQLVQEIRPGTTLRLIGTMADAASMLRDVDRLGLGAVIHMQAPPGPGQFFFKESLYEQMKASRIMFAPSREEGWGIAVCEALACGVPVVAYDLTVYRRIYADALTTVAVGDHRAMAEAITGLLDAPSQYDVMRERGKACAGRYEWGRLSTQDWLRVQCVSSEGAEESCAQAK